MCGLAGIARREPSGVAVETLDRMAATLRHRGPDGSGRFAGARVGLAHVRLSIIDVAGGAQPLGNEDGQVLVVYNGEIYNYVELRADFERRGGRLCTPARTPGVVRAYEEGGGGGAPLGRPHRQFAVAIY